MKGIDISNYQSVVDYARVKNSGIEAAYIKASEGQGYKDKLTATHYAGLKGQGILVGFYLFFKPSVDAIAQAQNFADVVKRFPSDLIHMCDIEVTEGKDKDFISNAVMTFINKVKELTGNECGIYTGSYFSKDNLTTVLRGTKLWLAHYTQSNPSWNTNIWEHWSGWQYSSSGQVNGIFGNVDVNNFNDDLLINGVKIIRPVIESGQVNGANAVVQNDWFFTRDSQGNVEEGHRIDIGDKIKVIDVSYSRQLALVEYPVPGGTRQAYIKNVASNIGYLYQCQWQNGSTAETIYQDSACTQPIGTIDPHESATPLFRENGVLNVVYNTDKGTNSKSGFVKYNGKFNQF
jgi:GH25 family lysozyme M1 (1,4-beta-N-acetylmuramidase)